MSHNLLQKSQAILEFLVERPFRAQLVTYLSENFSLNGDPCAVGVIQLARDGSLHCIAAKGFVGYDPRAAKVYDINSDRPTSQAIREQKLRIIAPEELKAFTRLLPKSDRECWVSGVAMPLGPQFMYFFFLPEDVSIIDDYYDFISIVASLLNQFELALAEGLPYRKGRWFEVEKAELTSRESEIEKLIVQGLTNAQIAMELGYSESLIRQETVSIYRKLGVSGRKELRVREEGSKGSKNGLIQAAIAISSIELLTPIISAFQQGLRVIS